MKNKKRFAIGSAEIDYQWGNAYGKNRGKVYGYGW